MPGSLPDYLIPAALVALAGLALGSRNLYRGVLLYIGLGLLLSLSWALLGAPDLALAEAAIGAGAGGALFIRAVHRFTGSGPGSSEEATSGRGSPLPAAGLATGLVGVLAAAVLGLRWEEPGLGPAVATALPESGAGNAVTAVLLNFRSYDTLLELTVLLGAGVLCGSFPARERGKAAGRELALLERLVVPAVVLSAGYVVWAGSSAPGGAFPAGALLAGGGVLRILTGRAVAGTGPGHRLLAGLALLGFLIAGYGTLALGGRFLEFPAGTAGSAILAIEVVAAVSIGYLLVLMYQEGPPP